MLVLLPPSEGKAAAPVRGARLDLARLSFTGLTATRSTLVDAVTTLCAGDPEVARQTLGLSPGLVDAIDADRRLLTSVTMPVARLYTGVLYDSLGLASLEAPALRRARRSLLVFSALWGAVRLGDRLPPYRLAPDVTLPGLGSIASLWKIPLAQALDEAAGRGLVLDLRSGSYVPLWRPTGAVADRTVTLRVLQERRPGDPSSRVVVSHFNKATKGRLVRALLESGADPRRPAGLVEAIRDLGFTAETGSRAGPGRTHQVDVIVAEL